MAIAEQFAGLEMDKLIGAPLSAAADASITLANSTADFINRVGFDAAGNVRTVAFMYEKRSVNEDGTSNLDEMKVDVPMLAIVPIPNLQVDEVNILFDMEVKQSERQESSMDLGATVSGTLNLGIVKVSVSGNVSAHSSNTRSSDNSAKYHVDVRATNHGTPEGLARVLDMMAANVAPSLVGSQLKDGNGQDLSEQAKIKAERLKALRQDISQIESRLSAAQGALESNIAQLKKVASAQQNVYQSAMMKLLNSLAKESEEAVTYSQNMDIVNQSWNTLLNQAPGYIKMAADSGKEDGSDTVSILELLSLKKLVDGSAEDYGTGESHYNALVMAEKNAIVSQKNITKMEEELLKKRADYSNAVAGRVTPELPGSTES